MRVHQLCYWQILLLEQVLQLLGESDETVFKTRLRAELTLALEQAAEAELELDDEDADG